MNNGVSSIIARVSILLDRMEIMVPTVMAVLPISASEVILWALKRTQRTMM